jgi:thioesterase domain-containing protein
MSLNPQTEAPETAPAATPAAAPDGSALTETLRESPALNALFARIVRSAERVILPVNTRAQDKNDQSPAFYCVHSLSGAGGTDFGHLAALMPAVRFFGIQAPPTKVRGSEFGHSVESIADYYADALSKFQPTGPFLLGGWSAGAIIGLEVAQNLRARGREVRLYAAIDAAPENTNAGLPSWHPAYIAEFTRNLLRWVAHDVIMTKGSFSSVVRRAVSKAVAKAKSPFNRKQGDKAPTHLNVVGGIMDISLYPDFERAFMNRLYAALFAYVPRSYAGEVIAYEADEKPLLRLPQVGRVWSAIAPLSVIVPVNGTHLSILKPGGVRPLADDLQRRIAAVSRDIGEHPAQAPSEILAPPLEKKTA